MPESVRRKMRVEMAQTSSPEKEQEPQKEIKKEAPEKELPLWNFPLQGRSVRAKNLAEALKIINIKK